MAGGESLANCNFGDKGIPPPSATHPRQTGLGNEERFVPVEAAVSAAMFEFAGDTPATTGLQGFDLQATRLPVQGGSLACHAEASEGGSLACQGYGVVVAVLALCDSVDHHARFP